MRLHMFKSKLHRAIVTDANLEYEGSITIDADLMEAARILPHEQVHVWDVTNGARLVTYALRGDPGSGTICVNGAGAHLVRPGDRVIIATYAEVDESEARHFQPTVVVLDDHNRMKQNL